MQIENTRQLHLLVGKGALSALLQLNGHQLKKKFPGEHIALVRADDAELARGCGLFSEVHEINLSYIQRSSFSPLLGDELAFSAFHDALSPLSSQTWTRIFNIKGTSIDTALSEIFKSKMVIGSCAQDSERRCQEAPLKLLRQLDHWGLGQPIIQKWLTAKAFGQLDWMATEVTLQKIIELKNHKTPNPLKNLVVGIHLNQLRETDPDKLAMLQQLFSVVDLSQEEASMQLFVDMVVTDEKPAKTPWSFHVALAHADPDSLSELLVDAIDCSLRKWVALSALFDYLGNARAALAAEKLMSRYDRDALQQFLMGQVMALKGFARVLLEGLRKQGSEVKGPLEAYWQATPDAITFNSAIELSLHPSILPLLRNDQDVLAIKRRMRSLNQFYERLHRAMALEIPKTDLELTL